jgi:hypothetical protein
MTDPPAHPGTPRWLKLSAVAAGVAALLIVIHVHNGGLHHHRPSKESLDHAAAREGAH